MPVFGVFLVRIFPHSDWIQRDIQSKCEKTRTRITPNTDTFRAVLLLNYIENLPQCKSTFSLLVDQIPAFALGTNLVREWKTSSNFKWITWRCFMLLKICVGIDRSILSLDVNHFHSILRFNRLYLVIWLVSSYNCIILFLYFQLHFLIIVFICIFIHIFFRHFNFMLLNYR